jgi:nucleotide-binding universal stress UspA family protein
MITAATQAPVRFRNILFATDFSTASARAIPYVQKIAKYYDSDIVALHVRPPAVNPMIQPPSWPSDETIRHENEAFRHDLLQMFPGQRAIALVEEGDIQSRLQTAIEQNKVDLMVLGTRGRTGLGKLVLGSVAEEIFRVAACPVLTVGPKTEEARHAHDEFKEILFATDFTSPSQSAAAYAVSLAQEFQARLVMLHVVPKAGAGELVSSADVSTAGENLLRRLVPESAQAWCKAEFIVERGDPAATILEIARLRESDLIVLGAKKETGVPGAASHLPIATAHKVVSQAVCPVLTVRS